jgi:hypothetical protein
MKTEIEKTGSDFKEKFAKEFRKIVSAAIGIEILGAELLKDGEAFEQVKNYIYSRLSQQDIIELDRKTFALYEDELKTIPFSVNGFGLNFTFRAEGKNERGDRVIVTFPFKLTKLPEEVQYNGKVVVKFQQAEVFNFSTEESVKIDCLS